MHRAMNIANFVAPDILPILPLRANHCANAPRGITEQAPTQSMLLIRPGLSLAIAYSHQCPKPSLRLQHSRQSRNRLHL